MIEYQFLKLVSTTPFILKVTLSFLAATLCVIGFSISLLFLIPYRLLLSLLFSVFYKGKYQLVDGPGSIFASWDAFGNVSNITGLLFTDGHCDIVKLRKRVEERILQRDKNGSRPYGIMLNTFIEKFHFLCQTDCSKTIDFSHHIRLIPEMSDPEKIYTEQEYLDVAAKLTEQEWPMGKPKWEILVARNVKCDQSGKIRSALFLKVHHLYMDGISFIQTVRKVVADKPTLPLLFDPVNPPIPQVPLLYKTIAALQSVILEPYFALRTFWNTTDHFLCEKRLGGKLYGRTSMKISRQKMRRIRNLHGCSTEAVFHSAFVGALLKMAMLKKMRIPPETIAAKVSANLPYPHEFPINLAFFGYQLMETGLMKDPIARLEEMNKFLSSLNYRHFALKSSLILSRILGWFPMPVVRAVMQLFKPSYYMSNVPGFQGQLKIVGNNVKMMTGFTPLCNGIGYGGAVFYHNGNFSVGFLINKSSLVSNREDMDTLIVEYENEIRYLDNVDNTKISKKYCNY